MDQKKEKITYIDIYEFHFFMYNLTGYTYVNHKVAWAKLFHALFHHTMCMLLVFDNLISIYMSIRAFSDQDDLIYILTMAGTTIGCTMKICMMEYYKEKVQLLHSILGKPLKLSELSGEEEADEERRKIEKEFQFITKAFYAFLPASLTVFIVLPVFFTDEKAVPYIFPVKNLETPFYELVYMTHGLISILFIINTVSYDMICYGLLLRLAANFKIISRGLRKFSGLYPRVDYAECIPGYSDYTPEENDALSEDTEFWTRLRKSRSYEEVGGYDRDLTKGTVEFLREVVRQHQVLRRQITLMDRIFNFNIFIQVVVGTAVSCMSVASLFSHFNVLKDIRLSGMAFGGFVDLYLYCYCGSRCIQSEEDFRRDLYFLPWYAMDAKVRKLIVLTLTRLQRVKCVTAGRMRNVSLDLFLGILKFSHSFIALLSES